MQDHHRLRVWKKAHALASIKSTSELESQLELAKDYGVLGHQHWQTLTNETVDVRRMLCGLRAKVLGPAPQVRNLEQTG